MPEYKPDNSIVLKRRNFYLLGIYLLLSYSCWVVIPSFAGYYQGEMLTYVSGNNVKFVTFPSATWIIAPGCRGTRLL